MIRIALICVKTILSTVLLDAELSDGKETGWGLRFGFPYQIEYSNQYSGGGYNWDIEWDSDGIAYIGRDKLWRWDGQSWDQVGSPALGQVRSLAFDGTDELWVGSYGEVGIYNTVSSKYEKVLDSIPGTDKPIGDVWKIKVLESVTWIALSHKLLRIDLNGNYKIFEFGDSHRVLFHFIDEAVYAHEVNVGLWRISDGNKVLLNKEEKISSLSLIYLESVESGDLVGISSNGIFRIENKINGNVYLSEFVNDEINFLSSAQSIGNSHYILGSVGNGIFIVNQEGEVVAAYGSESGLRDSIILDIEIDKDGNAWVLGSGSIWCLYLKYPLGLVAGESAVSGGYVNAIRAGEDGLMVSKESSTIYMGRSESGKYEKIFEYMGRGSNNVFHNDFVFFDSYDKLCTYGPDGVVEVYPLDSKILSFDIDSERNILYASLGSGLYAYEINDSNQINIEPFSYCLNESDIDLVRSNQNGKVWAINELNKLFQFNYSTSEGLVREAISLPVDAPSTPLGILLSAGGPVVVGDGGEIWIWREGGWAGGEVELDWEEYLAGDFLWSGDELTGYLMVEGGDWGGVRMAEVKWSAGGGLRGRWVPWPTLKDIGEIYSLEVTEGGRFYFGGLRGIAVADAEVEGQVERPGKPILWESGGGRKAGERRESRFGEERIGFRYTSAGGDRLYPLRYQTRLLGLEADWSAPTESTTRAYGRIFEGDYTFEVRALDPFGRVSEVARQELAVLPPWYRTGGAYGSYVVLLGAGIWTLVRMRERSLRRRQAELEATVRERTEELERANSFKDEFIANMSHEIRNPLNGVIGLIRQLKGGEAVPGGYLPALRSAADYLQTTVEDVLDFSRLQTGVIPIEKGETDLAGLLDGVVQIYRGKAEEKGLELVSRLEFSGELVVVTDGKKLAQILGNLTNNAVKFTETGRVLMGIKVEGDGPGEGILKLWVKDTGIGISAQDHERIFEKFMRVGGENRQGGTGLGLALVSGFVERLGGDLQVRSTPGTGSTFIVSLPVELREAEAKPADGGMAAQLAGLRVLGIEDIQYNRILLESILEEGGCAAELEEDGLAGLAVARRGEWDVLLVDWDLPGMNGLEITRTLREEGHRGIIIGMTAFATEEVRENCFSAGMDAFITKPIAKERLWALLVECGTTVDPARDGELREEKRAGKPGKSLYIHGRGMLGEMGAGDPESWEGHKARWSNLFDTYWKDLQEAVTDRSLELEAVRKAAHKLLGHVRMVDMAILPDILQELLEAAHEGNAARVQGRWDQLKRHLEGFYGEWEQW